MRFINGITGCRVGRGSDEFESKEEISVRVVDCADGRIALRIGTHSESARLTEEEARHVALLLIEAADRTTSSLLPKDGTT